MSRPNTVIGCFQKLGGKHLVGGKSMVEPRHTTTPHHATSEELDGPRYWYASSESSSLLSLSKDRDI